MGRTETRDPGSLEVASTVWDLEVSRIDGGRPRTHRMVPEDTRPVGHESDRSVVLPQREKGENPGRESVDPTTTLSIKQ